MFSEWKEFCNVKKFGGFADPKNEVWDKDQ